ncbi:ABC transporter substrate-binding protein [Maridesulfovibrio zosterae]|uniref:ABC transporter substrate-binding protein n=1 Tax=Maridesulfovibrio zosterae TaxID=82171 RepID=UPI00041DB71D|nr:extracellular solute-binding protein [Maridesulfovibrio zosterae]
MRMYKYLIIAAVFTIISGCAKSPTPENPVNLTVYGDINRVFETESADIGSITDFMSIHPEIKVEVIPEYDEWVLHEQALKIMRDPKAEQPDIIEMPGSWVASFAQEGLLLPIESWFEELPEREKKDFLAPLVTGYRYEKELYGLPALLGLQYLYGCKKMLPESGLPKTIEELVSTSRYIKEKHGVQGLIFPSKGLNLYKFYYTLLQIVLDGQKTENNLEAHVTAYKAFYALVKENQPDYEKFSHVVAEGEFRSGKAGMSINGNYVWYLLSLSKDVGFPVHPEHVTVGFLPMLESTDRRKNHVWSRGFVINKRTRHPEQALTLLHHLTSERADFFRLKTKYILPARKSAAMYGKDLPGMSPAPACGLYTKKEGGSENGPATIKIDESPTGWYNTVSKILDLLHKALATDMEPEDVAEKMVQIEKGLAE